MGTQRRHGASARFLRYSMLLVAMLPLLAIGWSKHQPVSVSAAASGDQSIYDDSLLNGWQDYGWATINYHNAQPTHSGGASISVREGAWQGLSIHHDATDSTPYSALSFWISGGAVGGQRLQVQGLLNGKAQQAIGLAPLSRNQWRQISLPLSSLGVAQDTAAQTGVGSHDIATIPITIDGAAPIFTIPPYKMEVVVLRPAVS